MNNHQNTLPVLLICGGLWGAAEATLGYLLHLLPCGFSGMLMFPIGVYFMMNVYQASQRHSAIFFTAIIAAGIKLIDLALPTRSPMSVINPAVSILLESLVVIIFVPMLNERRIYLKSVFMGLSWIILMIVSQALIFKPLEGLYLKAPAELLAFIILNAVVSGGLVGFYLKRPALNLPGNVQRLSYGLPTMVILFAVICEISNSLI
jgi:hypothetical protein